MVAITFLDTFLGCLVFALWTIIYFRSRKSKFPPGPWGFPILGHLPDLGLEPHKTATSWIPKYGPIVGLNFGSFPSIIISDYKLIKEAGANPAFSGRPKLQFGRDRSGGQFEGILFTEGHTWREQRTFTHRRLRELGGFGTRSMESAIMDQVQQLVQELRLEAGQPINTHTRFHITVLNALWETIAGTPFHPDDPEIQRLVKTFADSMSSVNFSAQLVIFVPMLNYLPNWITHIRALEGLYKPINEFLQQHLEGRYESHVQDKPRDFIDAFINEIENTSDPSSSFYGNRGKQSLTTTLLDLFSGGIETTGTTLEWICLLLARFPRVQGLVAAEIAAQIGRDRPSLMNRNQMPYTVAVLHEVMRFRTLVPLAVFHSTMEPVHFHGFDIPKDTMVFFNLHAAHADPKVWGDPDQFRPERWLNDDGTEFIRREEFMAFSTGKRACLGEQLARDELFLFTVGLIQTFCICIDPSGPLPTLEPKLGGSTVMPKPHRLIFKLRENQ